jgi:glutamate racemase
LLGEDVKMIIAACGTVSSVAPHVLNALHIPASGVVDPGADAAVKATRNGRIGVIGTAATIHAGSFRRRIVEQNPPIQVFQQACPLFVPLVENGWIDRNDEVTRLTAKRYLEPLRNQGIDTLLLGCTHFPLLAPIIADIVGSDVVLIDPGQATAQVCARRLSESDSLNKNKAMGQRRFYVSDRPENFTRIAKLFLGREVKEDIHTLNIETVDIPNTNK